MAISTKSSCVFFHSASPFDSSESSISIDASSSSCSSPPSFSLPPAHYQFLPDRDVEEFEGLKGYDHKLDRVKDYFDAECCHDNDLPTAAAFFRSDSGSRNYQQQRWNAVGAEKSPAAKKRAAGSWLLGFARIRPTAEENSTLDRENATPPGLVRSTSGSSLASSDTDLSSSSHGGSSSGSSTPTKKGVSFNDSVRILPVPHASTYSSVQRRKMYSSSMEVRQNKIRNKKEYRYDGYDWRNATEEWEMSVCMVTGELVHPAHTA